MGLSAFSPCASNNRNHALPVEACFYPTFGHVSGALGQWEAGLDWRWMFRFPSALVSLERERDRKVFFPSHSHSF